MIDDTFTTGEKMMILTESGIKVTGAEIEPAWESFSQQMLTGLKSKKVVAGEKEKKVRPDGAAEVGDEFGNAAAEALEGEDDEDGEGEEWNRGVQMESKHHAAKREASPVKSVVVPDGKGQGRRYTGHGQYEAFSLRWWYEIAEKDPMGVYGSAESILPSLAGLRPEEMMDLTAISTSTCELMSEKGRGKIDKIVEAGFALGSVAVVGAILAALQEGGKEGTRFAIGTLARDPLLKKLANLKWIRVIWSKKDGGGCGKGLQRPTHTSASGAGHE
jgi:hypothetical protein